ncbi:hypothetical protein LOTGIDRAFT_187118 [Lottia gigantea]|uniref:Ribosome-recycling factor, mitochondrial n=1 Tax=Lottia gigantea TaxID=225164 RepID=V4A4T8_LOTGI|nr:hypothetical protein LOTGIDRAFT_187118 [Lottia gigantea]ESO98893.1 hypothetical protein LOTGIDRAFT_187118 [Lottia gigantea]
MAQLSSTVRRLVPVLASYGSLLKGRQLTILSRTQLIYVNQHISFQPQTLHAVVTFRNYGSKKSKKDKGKKVEMLKDEEIDGIIDKDKLEEDIKFYVHKLKEKFMRELSLQITPINLDHIMIDTKEGKFHLNDIAIVSLKDPKLILIDVSSYPKYVKNVRDSLIKSAFNLDAQISGTTLHLPIPTVTLERRQNLIKVATSMAEKCKADIRNVQSKYRKKVQSAKAQYSKDFLFKIDNMINGIIKEYTEIVDQMRDHKHQELQEESVDIFS